MKKKSSPLFHSLLVMELNVVLLLLFFNSVLTQSLSSHSERSALFQLRSSLGIKAKYWPRKTDPCSTWVGIHCQNGRVTRINLSELKRTRVSQLSPQFAVDALSSFSYLASLNSTGFKLSGSIPEWFGFNLTLLEVLDLRFSSIVGNIPQSFGSLYRLSYMCLSGNSLTGNIPASLGQLSALLVMDLSDNLLTGTIPFGLPSFNKITKMDLSSNFLSGPIPPGFGSLSGLEFLNLSNNSFTGSIPAQLGNLSKLVELDLGFNFLSGSLPRSFGGLGSLRKLIFANNGLDGQLPGNLFANLTQLQYVVLSQNHFDGIVPRFSMSSRQLRHFDVSGNNFTGYLMNLTTIFGIPDVLFNFSNNHLYGNLTSSIGKFGLLDLSNNYLQGAAPNDSGSNIIISGNCFVSSPGQRSSEDCKMFYTHRDLYFNDDSGLHPVGFSLHRTPKRKHRLTYVLVGVFGGLGFIVVLVLVLVVLLKICGRKNIEQRGTANVSPAPEGGNIEPPKASFAFSCPGENFTYKQMLQATKDFSDTNFIKHGHSGDLFQGTLEGGFPVVIKRVDVRAFPKDSYTLELEFFNKFSHTRLIPLLGYCLEQEDEKFFVYKYMPNGDLSKCLYRPIGLKDASIQSLDWITRLKIAIGAAEGLSYLHHECDPPLVHRNIKATSILLDDKYEVRLGSLSEVRAQGGENHQNMITRLLRIPQSCEQGASGPCTTGACDVYCFGKVLLELVTGKVGISETDDASTKEWLEHNLPYISIYEKDQVAKIIDPSLIIDDDLLEEVWAVAIVAKSCLNPRASRRPLMRHILRALENPFKVVREEHFSSVRTTSSRRSWSATFFGSWRHSSSGSNQANRDIITVLKQSGRVGSQSSGMHESSSSRKRLSCEIFPEPIEMQDGQDNSHR